MSPFAFLGTSHPSLGDSSCWDLASDAGAGFAVAWHGNAVVYALLVVATQVAIVVGAAVLMMAVVGAFVVVLVCAWFNSA